MNGYFGSQGPHLNEDIYDGIPDLNHHEQDKNIEKLLNTMPEVPELNTNETLDTLSIALQDLVSEDLQRKPEKYQEFETLDYKLFSGNTNAKIMIVGSHPTAKEIKDDKLTYGKYGSIFFETAISAGFNLERDFFYTNLIPFSTMNSKSLSTSVVSDFLWVLDSQINILKPRLIITLGKDAANVMSSTYLGYSSDVKMRIGDIIYDAKSDLRILALSSPSFVASSGGEKWKDYNKKFYAPLHRAYCQLQEWEIV